ncbi:MAG: hypothetical protein EA396_12735 [Anaerolineaceae bacterium]|nr:MAG: hypothetical protein EA396_12735 [Anaerolineaceae bacterium]
MRRLLTIIWLTGLLALGGLTIPPLAAQEADDEPAPARTPVIRYGQAVDGRIDDDQPRRVYALDALRCDFISVRAQATGGDLDLVVMIVADDGRAIFARDDSAGTQDVVFEPLAIPRSGRFEVVVGRFGYALGTTSGTYTLEIERVGNGSAPNCAMRYGDTVFYNISDDQPEIIYSFRGRQGDIIDVIMRRRSGDLDPYLKIADALGVVLDDNDDMIGGDTKDAGIQGFVIPADGTYFIFATRYGQRSGTSTGNFSLHLAEGQFSGAGSTPLAALNIRYDMTLDGDLSENQPMRYYRFEAQQDELVTVRVGRSSGNLSPTVAITNASLIELANGRTAADGGRLIEDWLVPADGAYYVVVGREGASMGGYQLRLTSAGDAFDGVPPDLRRVRYGTSLTGNIDDETPLMRYVFFGEAGDTIRITMDRSTGDLDPVVGLANAAGTVLINDVNSGVDQNARIDRYTLPQTGVYYIEAGRFEGDAPSGSGGSFVLVIAQLFD